MVRALTEVGGAHVCAHVCAQAHVCPCMWLCVCACTCARVCEYRCSMFVQGHMAGGEPGLAAQGCGGQWDGDQGWERTPCGRGPFRESPVARLEPRGAHGRASKEAVLAEWAAGSIPGALCAWLRGLAPLSHSQNQGLCWRSERSAPARQRLREAGGC